MPHISEETIEQLEPGQPVTRAELAYEIARIVDEWIVRMCSNKKSELRWHILNEVEGVLTGVLAEYQRRIVGPYEQEKIIDNGSAFDGTERILFLQRVKAEADERAERAKQKKNHPLVPDGVDPETYYAYAAAMGGTL